VLTAACVLTWLAGCATTSEQCKRDTEQCLRRCQNAGIPDKSKELNGPYVSESTCEHQCDCREHKAPAPAPSGPPTFTGN
jgi:hypothetical protein